VNIIVMLNGQDVTSNCLLSATRIAFDSSKRITTASISIMAQALNRASRYDYAHYDVDSYSIALRELFEVTILDGRDGTTKLFDGNIYAMTLQQSDTPGFSVFYQCDLSDWSAYLDRAVCWDSTFAVTMPNSDQGIITALLGHFCPTIHLASVALVVPTIQKYDWLSKTCRQVLDDLSTLAMATWRVDFNGNLYYQPASAAPPAPFTLSTSPDYVTKFPVRVENYRHDFTNPVNHAYVRGAVDPATGAFVQANYSDPVSIGTYGEYAAGMVDTSIITAWDAALKAKSTVLTYAYPIETGSFVIWGPDGLACGMQVHIIEENLGIDGTYTIRALTMQWEDQSLVRYEAQFGPMQPDLETILRLIAQRTMWATANPTTASAVAPGTVTDASIAPPGLSASSIQSVNASTITGLISAGQIGSVNAGSIVGTLTAGQIATVNATSITGAITAGQIGTVNATSITGVVVSSQLANGIIDSLAKFATALTPVRMVKTGDPWPPTMPNNNYPPNSFFYYQPDGNFYQVNSAGTGWSVNNNPQGSLTSFYNIGAMSATSIVGLILAAQIQSITAGQITGSITASQIASVNASTIAGTITAGQIASVNASAIAGSITASQIASVNASAISGTISAGQIASVNASSISGSITAGQISSVNATTINTGTFNVGTGSSMAAQLNIYNGSTLVAELGYLGSVGSASCGGWFQVFGAGGTSYSNASVYTDTGGNLYVKNANFSVVSGSTTISTSTATFDGTLSLLAIKNTDSTDSCSFISRGIVCYYGGSKVGAVVRDPGGAFMTLDFSAPGHPTVQVLGNDGTVRADGGFTTSGNVGKSGTFTTADGKTATVTKGIITELA
jgi:hypothetical protein